MLISTILGRFVIPIYYVLGERIIRAFSRPEPPETQPANPTGSARKRPGQKATTRPSQV